MKALLTFLVKNITGSEEFEIHEDNEENRVILTIKPMGALMGIIIGKDGQTIRSIRKIMSIKGTVDNKLVNVSIASD